MSLNYKKDLRIVKNDNVLMLQPKIIAILGRSEALFIQQLNYWLNHPSKGLGVIYEGRRWIHNTFDAWSEQLMLSARHLRRLVRKLVDLGVLLVKKLSPYKTNHTNYYTLDEEKLTHLITGEKRETKETCHILNFSSREEKSSFFTPLPDKMTQSNGPNVRIIKETKTTTNINHNSSEINQDNDRKIDINKEDTKNVNISVPLNLLEIWNNTVGIHTQTASMTPGRARFLMAAFKFKFQSSLEKWTNFCKSIASSDFLMGRIKNNFYATLDWCLKYETVQRILEGQFGVKQFETSPLSSSLSLSDETFMQAPESMSLEIAENTGDNTLKDIKHKLLTCLGHKDYKNWIHTHLVEIRHTLNHNQKPTICLMFDMPFICNWVDTHFAETIRTALGVAVVFSVSKS